MHQWDKFFSRVICTTGLLHATADVKIAHPGLPGKTLDVRKLSSNPENLQKKGGILRCSQVHLNRVVFAS